MKQAERTGEYRSATRRFRRERLIRVGSNLEGSLGTPVLSAGRTSPAVRRFLNRAARESGMIGRKLTTYRVSFPSASRAPELARLRPQQRQRSIHVLSGSRSTDGQHPAVTAIIVTTEAGRIVHVRRVHSR